MCRAQDQPVETVITVCGNEDQACPMFPGQLNRHHWGFYDPAQATGTDEEKLAVFRRVRDEIKMVFEAYAAGRRDKAKAAQPVPETTAPPAQRLREKRGANSLPGMDRENRRL